MSITLRKMTREDLPLFEKWLFAPHVARWYYHPQAWLDEVIKQDGEFCWIKHFIAEHDARPVGFCQYYPAAKSDEEFLDLVGKNGTYSIDYLIGEQSDTRRGFCSEMVARLTAEILKNPDARRIAVQPERENVASCSMLSACGFKLVDEKNNIFVREL